MKHTLHVWHFGSSLKHVHLYCQKTDAVRRAGERSGTFVISSPKGIVKQWSRIRSLKRQCEFCVLPMVQGKRLRAFFEAIFVVGLLCLFLPKKRVVFYLLKVPVRPFMLAIKIGNSFFHRRWICLLEKEGDLSAENDYQGLPYTEDDYLAEVNEIEQVDGLVLMSEEHIQLWEGRLNKKLTALALPPVVHGRYSFNSEARSRIRNKNDWNDKTVLVYCGNIECPWQNFSKTCEIAQRISGERDLHFLVLTWDTNMALSELEKVGLTECSTVMSVSPEEVPEYLSAADVGFFLRDDHLMCRIVTSAKLGEYLACGLPIITTGIAALYPVFSERNHISIKVDPATKELLPDNMKQLTQVVDSHGEDQDIRKSISAAFHREFNEQDISASYLNFIQNVIGEIE